MVYEHIYDSGKRAITVFPQVMFSEMCQTIGSDQPGPLLSVVQKNQNLLR